MPTTKTTTAEAIDQTLIRNGAGNTVSASVRRALVAEVDRLIEEARADEQERCRQEIKRNARRVGGTPLMDIIGYDEALELAHELGNGGNSRGPGSR